MDRYCVNDSRLTGMKIGRVVWIRESGRETVYRKTYVISKTDSLLVVNGNRKFALEDATETGYEGNGAPAELVPITPHNQPIMERTVIMRDVESALVELNKKSGEFRGFLDAKMNRMIYDDALPYLKSMNRDIRLCLVLI